MTRPLLLLILAPLAALSVQAGLTDPANQQSPLAGDLPALGLVHADIQAALERSVSAGTAETLSGPLLIGGTATWRVSSSVNYRVASRSLTDPLLHANLLSWNTLGGGGLGFSVQTSSDNVTLQTMTNDFQNYPNLTPPVQPNTGRMPAPNSSLLGLIGFAGLCLARRRLA